jgi:hypothetical protein
MEQGMEPGKGAFGEKGVGREKEAFPARGEGSVPGARRRKARGRTEALKRLNEPRFDVFLPHPGSYRYAGESKTIRV